MNAWSSATARAMYVMAALVLAICARATPPVRATSLNAAEPPGVLMIRFHPGADAPRRIRQAAPDTLAMTHVPQLDLWLAAIPGASARAASAALHAGKDVVYVEVDGLARAAGAPDDPFWPLQWGPERIEAPQAWSLAAPIDKVVVAVLDSGTTPAHPDLAGQLWVNPGEIAGNGLDDDGNGYRDDVHGWRFYHRHTGGAYIPADDAAIEDDNGHGTHVAGIAAAAVGNSVGIAGVAGLPGGARLMTVKVLDQYGNGWYSDIARGIVYAVDNGARVLNLSLGGTTESQALQDAVDYAYAHGALVVAATGNTGGPVLYPAACDRVVGVAATDRGDARASFSNRGPQVDLAAPGVDVYSTWPGLSGYYTKSGTSMATPHVAGVAALMWGVRPTLALTDVVGIMAATAVDVNGMAAPALPGRDADLGWGRVSAAQAVTAARAGGPLRLDTPARTLTVGAAAPLTITVPFTAATPVTVTAANAGVAPGALVALGGVATGTLTGGFEAGPAVVTATTGVLTATHCLQLLPDAPVSSTLALAPGSQATVWPGRAISLTLWAEDRYGNAPVDGTPIVWTAAGGSVGPALGAFDGGIGRATFTAGVAFGRAVVTATLETGLAATQTLTVTAVRIYMPVLVVESAAGG